MKNKKWGSSIILVVLLTNSLFSFGQSKGIISLGNGEMCVYEDQSDIIQLFGPPYSSPSVFQLTLEGEKDVDSKREIGTAIWTHSVKKGVLEVTKMVDFVATENTGFVRSITTKEKVEFLLKLPKETTLLDNTPNYKDKEINKSLLLISPAGTYAYQNVFYPTMMANYYEFMVKGNVEMEYVDDLTWKLTCMPGQSYLFVTSGRDYPSFINNTKEVLSLGYNDLLAQTRETWRRFTAEGIDYDKLLPANVPQRERLLQAIDDVAVIIKTQQGTEGSVLAGYNYHLGYVRDQYGVSRGLIKLGHVKDAIDVMDFYWNVFDRRGLIRNAQGIGLDAFHVHENDEVEITGYLIIQAFDLLEATGDDAYIQKIFPMLEWAWECQVKNLHHDMLPFNGDETYIAGGILPRTAMFDGSAEATMLFLTGGKLLNAWAEKNAVWSKEVTSKNKKILDRVESHYNANFMEDGKLLTNNPARKDGLEFPDFRHGVCESCYRLDWSHRTENNRYLCAHCIVDKDLPSAEDQKFYLQSVSLLPWYIDSDVLTDKQIKKLVKKAADAYAATGKLPSRPDGNRTVGYDYGLFLFSLTKMNHPLKNQVYEQMLSVLDPSGAWVEYYESGVPSGTLCRPWESAINIEAAIDYAMSLKK